MKHLGDFRLGDTFDTKFTTTAAATGAPTTLAGTPVISAYVGNSVTQITAGITLTVDFDAVTGLHNVRVVATSGNGFATASNYQLVITTGTVGGTSAVGYVIAEFSIEARSAVMPTVAARTLDVSATGEAGLDWANIGAPTTAQNLSATNIDVDQVVASVSGAVGSVTGLTAANLDATVSSRASAAALATVQADTDNIQTRLPTVLISGTSDSGSTTTMVDAARTEATTDHWRGMVLVMTSGTNAGLGRLITGFNAATDTITVSPAFPASTGTDGYEIWPASDAILAQLTHTGATVPTVTTVGTLTTYTGDTPQTGDSFARIGAPAGASVSADVAAIQSDTNDLQTRVPAALVGGRMDANASAIDNIATAAVRLGRSTQGIVTGTVGAASTTISIVTSALDPAAAVIDQYKGRIVTFGQGTTTANLRGQSTDITASTGLGVLTVTALTTAPVSGDTFTIT